MPAEKSTKVNLVLPPSLWKKLASAAATCQCGRAQFIRLVLEAACKQPQAYLPRAPVDMGFGRQVPRGTMYPSAPPSPEPSEPEELPWATREHARQGMVSCDLFRIPPDWIEWSTEVARTRAEVEAAGEGDDACLAYEPPRTAPSAH
jgi:hypothetical protein